MLAVENGLKIARKDGNGRGLKPNFKIITTIIDALEKADHWQEALSLINTIEAHKLQPTVSTLNTIVRIAIRCSERQKVLDIVDTLDMRYNLAPSVVAYNAIFSACRDMGEWQVPLKLLKTMDEKGLKPNVGIITTVIEALSRDGQCEKAFDLLNSMKERGLEPNRLTYNATVLACVTGGQPDKAMEVLKLTSTKYDDATIYSYETLIRILEQEAMW